jgi:hypothetical protein
MGADNENPTIFTDLPTRRGQAGAGAKKAPGWEVLEMMPMGSFGIDELDLSDPESEQVSDEDADVEPIDEQEIYGMLELCAAIRWVANKSIQTSSQPSPTPNILSL